MGIVTAYATPLLYRAMNHGIQHHFGKVGMAGKTEFFLGGYQYDFPACPSRGMAGVAFPVFKGLMGISLQEFADLRGMGIMARCAVGFSAGQILM